MALMRNRIALLIIASALGAGPLAAQELEPRLFNNLPLGANIITLTYSRSEGNVLFDASLPIEGAEATLNSGIVQYVRSLGVGGRSARLEAIVPYSTGHWEGQVNGQFAETRRDGFADARVRFVVNFSGAPALRGAEYLAYRQRLILGAGLQVIAPTGQYDGARIVNLGSNRWAIRPQIGMSRALGAWTLEAEGSVWFFTDNDDSMGETLEQEPLYTIQGHALYRFRNGVSLGVNAGFGDGGKVTVEGATRSTLENSSRLGSTLSVPFDRRHGLTFAFATYLKADVGSEFDNYALAYRFLWGG
jgi:hypothetical protein